MAEHTGNPGSGNPTGTTGVSPASTSGANRENLGRDLGEARSHLGKAATAAGDSLKGAGRAARDELRSGSEGVRSELNELAAASRAAALDAREVADETMHDAAEYGRDLLDSAERMIREKPLQAIGIAALAGFLIAKLR